MSLEITARHVDVSEELQDYAREKAEVLIEEFPRIEHIHVILDAEKHRQIAEVVVQGKNHIRVGVTESSDNMKVSIDKIIDRVEKNLRKERDKIQNHTASRKQSEQQKDRGELS